jgi:Fic family protein
VPGTRLTNGSTGEIVYTPPAGESLLRDLLANWEKFIHDQADIDPLIRLAVAHYQFEAIHPFTDGNGRTGRVINSLFLIQEDLLTLPILYLSRYIIKNRAEYYDLLQKVTSEGAWELWILYILKGVEEMANWTTAKIDAVEALSEHTKRYIRTRMSKAPAHELNDLIFRMPYCRIGDVVSNGIAQRQTASIYLRSLVDIGVLQEVETTKEKLFIHPRLVSLLTTDTNQFQSYESSDPPNWRPTPETGGK